MASGKKETLLVYSCALLLTISLFLSSALSLIYSKQYYESEFQKYRIYDRFSRERLSSVLDSLFSFFRGGGDLDRTFFSADEASHLADVKAIIGSLGTIFLISVGLLVAGAAVIIKAYRKDSMLDMFKTAIYSCCAMVLSLLAAAIAYSTFGFEYLFQGFHELFFTGNYSFDPAVSNMKFIFPDGFFLDFAISILYRFIILEFFIFGISGIAFYLSRRNAARRPAKPARR